MTNKNRHNVIIHPHSGCLTLSGSTPSQGITMTNKTPPVAIQKKTGGFFEGSTYYPPCKEPKMVVTLESLHKQFDSFYAFEKATGVHTNTQKQWLKNHALVDSEGYVYIRNRGGVQIPQKLLDK